MELWTVPATAVDIQILIKCICIVFRFGPEDEAVLLHAKGAALSLECFHSANHISRSHTTSTLAISWTLSDVNPVVIGWCDIFR
jgi:hypothetical protein